MNNISKQQIAIPQIISKLDIYDPEAMSRTTFAAQIILRNSSASLINPYLIHHTRVMQNISQNFLYLPWS